MGQGYMKAKHDRLGWNRSKVRLVLRGRYLLRGRLRVQLALSFLNSLLKGRNWIRMGYKL